jgi:hypothetical protein
VLFGGGFDPGFLVVVVVEVVPVEKLFDPLPFTSLPPDPVVPLEEPLFGALDFEDPEPDDGCCEPVLEVVVVVVLVDVLPVVTVAAGVVTVAAGAHTSDTLCTGPTPAGTNDEAGVPGAALTVNVSV